MSHGAPDYSNVAKDGFTFRLDDMGELSARLGSLVTYDRRGDVIWYYGFENGIGDVGPTITGTTGAIDLLDTIWEKPPFSVRLTGGSTIGNNTSIERRLALTANPRIGYACAIRASSACTGYYHNIWHYDGSLLWHTWLLFKFADNSLFVHNYDNTDVLIDNALPDIQGAAYFSHIKLVVDLSTHKLVRGMFDDIEYDLSAYSMHSSLDTTVRQIMVKSTNWSFSASLSYLLVDNMIISTNEP